MLKTLKMVFIISVIAMALIFLYRFAFIRVVNYEIGGVKIPSMYNIATGTVRPILNYKGKENLRTVESQKANKLGLTESQVIVAKLRWAIFEEWANSRKEYRGWQKDPVLFKKANDAFRKQLEAYGKSAK